MRGCAEDRLGRLRQRELEEGQMGLDIGGFEKIQRGEHGRKNALAPIHCILYAV